jgi:4-coumarate--CoA ligase
LRNLGLTGDKVNERIVVLGSSLNWLGGSAAPGKPEAAGLVHMEDLLKLGSLTEEEKFDGSLAHETVYLCYSSGGFTLIHRWPHLFTPCFLGTTGKSKGVEVLQ